MDKLKDYVDEQMVRAPLGGTRESVLIWKTENLSKMKNSEYNATRSSRLSEKSRTDSNRYETRI